jgi:hypothetical protein
MNNSFYPVLSTQIMEKKVSEMFDFDPEFMQLVN